MASDRLQGSAVPYRSMRADPARDVRIVLRPRSVLMRVLFTTQPGAGHFHPLVPLAQALRDVGHDVAFAGAPFLPIL